MSQPIARDTITWRDDMKRVTITNRIGQKYAHKLLQDWIKEKTGIKGYWTFYHDSTDEHAHAYIIDHPFYYKLGQEL